MSRGNLRRKIVAAISLAILLCLVSITLPRVRAAGGFFENIFGIRESASFSIPAIPEPTPPTERKSEETENQDKYKVKDPEAVLPSEAMPESINAGVTMFATNTANHLFVFDSSAPNVLVDMGAITNLGAGENILGIDVRPATGQLYGLGITDNGSTRSGRILLININTLVATPVGPAFRTDLADINFWGFDFNPIVDRIRVTNRFGANMRVNPNNGSLTSDDTNLSVQGINGIGYDRNEGTTGLTTLYAYNFDLDRFGTVGGVDGIPSPNGGVFTEIGPSGFVAQDRVQLDIEAVTNIARLSANNGAGIPQLRTVNLTTGTATLVGSIGVAANSLTGLTTSSTVSYLNGTSGPDTISLVRSGSNVVATGVVGGPVTFPLSGLTGIVVNGLAGADQLTVDYSGGNFVVPVTFNGGDLTASPGDRLVTVGGNFATGSSNPTGPNDGALVYTGGATGNATINYTGLEPIDDLNVVANYTVNGTNAINVINIVDGPVVLGTQTTQVNEGGNLFELVNFANKTTVTVNSLDGNDSINFNNPNRAVGLTTLNIDGGNNTVNATTTFGCGGTTLPTGDIFSYSDGSSVSNNTYTISVTDLIRNGQTVFFFSNMETVNFTLGTGNDTISVDAKTGVNTNVNGNVGNDTIGLNVGSGANAQINGDAGQDTITVTGTGTTTSTQLSGGVNNDTFNVVQAGGSMDNIGGPVCISGDGDDGGVGDTVNYNDQNDASNNVYTLTNNTLTRSGSAGVSRNSVETVNLNAGTGSDTVNVTSSFSTVTTTVNAGSGGETINVGNAGSLDALLGPVTINGDGATDALNINDQNDSSGNTYSLSGTTLTRTGSGSITYGTVESFVLNEGPGGDIVGVTGTSTATTINGNDGNDTFNVSGGGPMTINGDSNNATPDSPFGCNPALVLPIGDSLNYNDGASGSNNTYNVSVSDIVRNGQTVVFFNTIESVGFVGGTGNDTISVDAKTGAHTTVSGNAGNDTISLNVGTNADARIGGDAGDDTITTTGLGTNGSAVVNGGPNNDTFNTVQAGGSMDNVGGNVCIVGGTNDGGPGDTVNFHDAGDASNNTYGLTDGELTRTGMPGGITFSFVETVNLNAGTGNDTVNLIRSLAGVNTTINGATGNETVNIGSNGSLDFVLGPVNVNGDAGASDELNINDQNDTDNNTYTATGNSVTRTGSGTITYGTTESVVLNGGTGNDTLAGPNSASIYNITANNTGNIPGALNSFTNIENLLGGAGSDTFVFANGVGVTGTINGGTTPGDSDTLDYSAYTTSMFANLGLSTTGLAGNIGPEQEVPPVSATGTGTATISNYNTIAKTFDISVTVNNMPPAQVTDFHIHRAIVGVAGPVIINLRAIYGLGSLVPNGNGFTFNAVGVALPPQHEAAFLGGVTYVNFHTAANPSGEIRGQLFSQANVNGAQATATGTGGIANIENVTGGSGTNALPNPGFGDSLVGNNAANILIGNNGNDTLLGAPGADTMSGGAGDDVMIWSNGDGSDVMDGNADNDAVQVNGNPTNDDTFQVNPGAGGRLAFARTSAGPFTLDIGTSETLAVNGIGGNDTFNLNSLAAVNDLSAVSLNGFDGNDIFNVVPAPNGPARSYTVRGGPPTSFGDVLNVDTSGVANPLLTLNAIGGGSFTSTSHQTITIFGIEPRPTTVTLGSSVNPSVFGQNVTFTATVGSTAAGPALTGTVQFVIDGNNFGAPVALAGNSAQTNISSLSVGNHNIQAIYSGDSNYATGTGNFQQTVSKAGTATTLTANANPIALGQSVTFTATVGITGQGAGQPAGSIEFRDNNVTIPGCLAVTLSAGLQAQCVTSALTGGSHNITALYSGDNNFASSTGNLNGNPLVVDIPPTATATAANINTQGGASHTVSVTYTDDFAIAVGSLDSGDIRVTGPNGFNSAVTFVSVNNNTNGTPRTATYTFTAPGGTWDLTDNGTYTIVMQGGQVQDTFTSPQSVSPGTIGTFTVAICNPQVTTLANAGAGSLREAVTNACNGSVITFAQNLAGSINLTAGEIAIPTNLTIQGPGANVITVAGNNAGRVFSIPPGLDVSINDLTVTGGRGDFGGGIFHLNAALSLRRVVVAGNTATAGSGGGVYNNAGTLTITDSTIASNAGGGVLNSGVLTIINSTISGNTGGAGVANLAGTATLTSDTVTNNASGASNAGGGSFTVQNTIIAGNAGNADAAGSYISNGYNLIGNAANAAGFNQLADQTGTAGLPVNAQLAPLASNGGPTPTHAFSSTLSPAIDKGRSFNLATDQRGSSRPVDFPTVAPAVGGDNSDIGAYEAGISAGGAGAEGDINRTSPTTANSSDGVVDLKDLQWYDNFVNGTFIPDTGGAAQPLAVGASAQENQRRDVAPVNIGGDGCLNAQDRQQMVLFALSLAAPGSAGGTSILNQCPPVRPETSNGSRRDEQIFGVEDRRRGAVIDQSIKRAVRLISSQVEDGVMRVTIEMDAAGDETRGIFNLSFDPAAISIDQASFPAENEAIALGSDAPRGTTTAVNARTAAAGRITVYLDFAGAIPSGNARRLVTLGFRVNGGITTPLAPNTESLQIVNGEGTELKVRMKRDN